MLTNCIFVVSNFVMHPQMGSVANFIRFPAVKSFENRLKFDNVTERLKVEPFLRHSVDSEKSSIKSNKKLTTCFQRAIYQPRSCVTPNFHKMEFRYPNLSFFAEI